MKIFRAVASSWCAVLFLTSLCRAEPRVISIEWQEFAKPNLRARASYSPIDKLRRAPTARAAGKVRAVVTLENAAKESLEAIDLDFVVSARLRKIGSDEKPTWAVPFRIAARPIPLLGGGQRKAVPLETLNIEAYLKELLVSGYWPVALKLEAQLRPRKGVPLAEAVASELPVEWEAANARP